jgi:hypothetical protein
MQCYQLDLEFWELIAPTTYLYKFTEDNLQKLVWAACMRCHWNRCWLLRAFSLFSRPVLLFSQLFFLLLKKTEKCLESLWHFKMAFQLFICIILFDQIIFPRIFFYWEFNFKFGPSQALGYYYWSDKAVWVNVSR